MNFSIKYLLVTLLCLGLLLSINCIFLFPQFQGKTLIVSDAVGNKGIYAESEAWTKSTGKGPMWVNNVFSGMPFYTSNGSAFKPGILNYIHGFLLRGDKMINYFMYFSIVSFLGYLIFGLSPWLSLIAAFATVYSTAHIDAFEAAHNSKMGAASLTIMMIAGLYRLYRKDYKLGGLAITASVALSLNNQHPQMTYYALIGVGIILLFLLARQVLNREYKHAGLMAAVFAGGVLLAVSANYYSVVALRNYQKQTMRGGSILAPNTANQAAQMSSSKEGLGWDYAMQWSNGFSDLFAMIIPRAVGGSSNEYIGNDNSIQQKLKVAGIAKQESLPLYFGSLPFTGAPPYMGAIVMLLFCMGLYLVKGPFKWGIAIATFLLVLLSMGKHFSIFNKLVFELLPFYKSFRTPNSIMNVVACIIPAFAFYTLYHIIKKGFLPKDEFKSSFLYGAAPYLGLTVLYAFLGNTFFSSQGQNDAGMSPQVIKVLEEIRISVSKADAWRTILFATFGIGTIVLYWRKSISSNILIALIGIATFADLWSVGKRCIKTTDFKPAIQLDKAISQRPADAEILKDNDLYFRVYDLSSGDPFQNSTASNFHKSIGGYHPAKLRRYQDIISGYLEKGNQNLINMLNTKYIINQNAQVQQNPSALGNAWFVSDVKPVKTPDEEFSGLGGMDPLQSALVLDSEFPGYVTERSFDRAGTIKLTKYSPEALTYSSQSTTDGFAIFSEVWDSGWQAYIDGQPVPHIRANYILRALKIPAGDHTIDFKYEPKKVIRASVLGYWLNNLVGILLLALFFYLLYGYWKNPHINATVADPVVTTQAKSSIEKEIIKAKIKNQSKKK